MIQSPVQQLSENINVLPELVEKLEKDIEQAEQYLLFKGKTMRSIQDEQVQWHIYYEQRKNEAKSMIRWLNRKLATKQTELFKQSVEHYQFDLSDRARERIVATDPACLDIEELIMEVELILDKLQSICDAFKTRGFIMRDKTSLLTTGLHDIVI